MLGNLRAWCIAKRKEMDLTAARSREKIGEVRGILEGRPSGSTTRRATVPSPPMTAARTSSFTTPA
jgi:hypothetical protein